MNRVLVLCAALLASGGCIETRAAQPKQAVQLEFKTLVIGAPTTPEQVETALAVPCGTGTLGCSDFDMKIQEMTKVKCGLGAKGIQVCNGTTTIAGHDAKVNAVIGVDGCLQRIYLILPVMAYNDVIYALVEKFGQAQHVESSTLQNGFGAIFQQESSHWVGDNSATLNVNKYAGDTRESSIYFSTAADLEMSTKSREDHIDDL